MSRSARGGRRSRRMALVALLGVVALVAGAGLAIEGLRTEVGQEERASARALNKAESVGPVVEAADNEIDAFRDALWAAPVISTSDRVAMSFADRERTSAALIEGTIRAATVGPDHLVVDDLVQCEAADGVPRGEKCAQRLSVKMVTFVIHVEEARMLVTKDGLSVAAGQEITLELLVGATNNGSPAAADAAQAIVDSAPIGSRVVSFGFQNPAGKLQQAGPDAWALVDRTGGFVSLSQGGADSGQGFLGLQHVSELGL